MYSRLKIPGCSEYSHTCYFSEQGCIDPVSLPLGLTSGRYLQEDKGERSDMFSTSSSCFTTTVILEMAGTSTR